MTSVIEKLRALQPTASSEAQTPAGRDGLVGIETLGLERGSSSAGDYWLREKTFAFQDWPELQAVLDLQPQDFVCIGKNRILDQLQPMHTAWIDTETTGLAGGTGTCAFLVGVARLQQGSVVVRQFFMHDFFQERAMLTGVAEWLEDVTGLVSYNGKTFDLPLLHTRCILNRVPMDWSRFLHLDLLHTSRRLWRPFAPDSRLSSMEQAVLGFRRTADVPGELIPSLYFDSLRTRDLAPLKQVFQHNAFDLISLLRLLIRAAQVFRCSGSAVPFHRLGVARTYEYLGLYEQASEACVAADDSSAAEHYQMQMRRAWNLKRLRRYQEAEQIWLTLLNASGSFSPDPYLELIKYYEHRSKEYAAALTVIRRVRTRAETLMELQPEKKYQPFLHDLCRREARIRQKQTKISSMAKEPM